MDKQIETKLQNVLLKGSPILFTGAGFSKGALNNYDEAIPDGGQLKKLLIEKLLLCNENDENFSELNQASLSDLCSYCENQCSVLKVQDFLSEYFSYCKPQKYHEIVANFPWSKIYTTNIDDLFENASRIKLRVQNRAVQCTYTRADSIEYIKLHGCVRNPSGKYVFSRQQYIDSMMHSTDYRFSSFARDMQTENFVFLGFDMNEINLDYYLKLYQNAIGHSINGQLFFVNPYPNLIFKDKISQIGGCIVEMSTEQFANFLAKISENKVELKNGNIIKGYVCVNKDFSSKKALKSYDSNLYLGYEPKWCDIYFDWDFINPQIEKLVENIKSVTEQGNMIVSIVGKAMCGKSIYLKRIGLDLVKANFETYEFIDRRFDYNYFLASIKNSSDSRIALLVDNASFYYGAIRDLVNNMPPNKRIVVITTSRKYLHGRKRYNLISEASFYEEYLEDNISVKERETFAKSISKKLDEKGFLGELKSLSDEQRINFIYKNIDLSTLLYKLTYGTRFKSRLREIYVRQKEKLKEESLDFLILLAIFKKVDLPYVPLELLGLLETDKYQLILDQLADFIQILEDKKGVMLRNDILLDVILSKVNASKKIELLTRVLMTISPQATDKVHSYWNEIQSTLMKGKLLRSNLKMSNTDVKTMLVAIKNYYNEDFNYWIQVGIAEQNNHDYEKALNRFKQAESLNPRSYLVQNVIARNFLRQANQQHSIIDAEKLFIEGKTRMLKLINERDEFQVKAYSTHCYIYEQICFWEKFDIKPKKEEVASIIKLLKNIESVDPNDPMAKQITKKLALFLQKNNIKQSFSLNDRSSLSLLKGRLKVEELNADDFEIEE